MLRIFFLIHFVYFYCFTYAQINCAECDIPLKKTINDSLFCTKVEQMPSFGDNDASKSTINFSLYVYNALQKKGIKDSFFEKKFYFSFLITPKGQVCRIKCLEKKDVVFIEKRKNQYSKTERAIVNIIKTAPKWIPGKCNGKYVPVFIRFFPALKTNLNNS